MKLGKHKKPIILGIGIIIALSLIGTVGALNGWFGGGGSIPSDTMTRGLVGYWNFDEGSGSTAYDGSGNENNGTLTGGSGASTLYEYYITGDDVGRGAQNLSWQSQTFTPSTAHTITSVKLLLWRDGLPGTVTVGVSSTDGTHPTAPSLCSATTTGNDLTIATTGEWREITMSAGCNLSASTKYAILIGAPNGNVTNAVYWQQASTSATYSGGNSERSLDGGSTWETFAGRDFMFEEWGTSGTSGTSSPSTWTKGKVGSALQFDGTDDYVDVGNVGNVRTVEFWVNNSNAADGVLELINNSIYISIASSVITATGFTSPTIYVNGSSASASLASGWNHVVVTDTADVAAASFLIGEANSNYTSGLIDEVKIFNRTLSASEVRYHYNRGGPVAQWKFDEGSATTTYDATDNNNDGKMYWMSTSTGGGWTAGKYGSALSFDGTDDYVDLGAGSSLGDMPALTISAWIKRNVAAVGGQDHILTNWTQSYHFILSGNKIELDLWTDNGQSPALAGTTIINNNVWYYLTGTYDGSKMKVYVNGILESTANHTGDIRAISGGNVYISNNTSGWEIYRFNGLIDDVRIYNYARTPEEIRLDYNAGFAALFGPQTGCDQDPGSCMTNGLVGYWPFEEGNGTLAYDSSNYANNGTLTAGPSWAKGKVGGALSFDGVDDYVNIPNSASLKPPNYMSIEAWVKPNTLTNSTNVHIYRKDSGTDRHLFAFQSSGTILSFGANFGGSYAECDIGITASDWLGKWNYAVATYDGSYVRVYKDGTEIGNCAKTGVLGTTDTAAGQIAYPEGGATFNGLIDEVRIYNRALSAAEVRYHYNRGGPVAQWKFDEGEGRTAYDSTDNNNDGTLVLAGSATSSAWVSGKYGGALSFDGVNDYVRAEDSSSFSFSNNAVTLEAWIKTSSADTTNPWWILAQCNIDVEPGIVLALPIGSKKLYYYDCNGKEVVSNSDVRDNKWHQVVYVSESLNSHKIYIDGKLDKADVSNVEVVNSTQPLLIGAILYQSGPLRFFDGLIDDVRIYNYARTAEEIRLDYNAGYAALFGPQTGCDQDPGSCMTNGLVGYWGMEDGSGQTAMDSSGSNNGTLGTGSSVDTSDPAWTKGKVGGALSFDGTDDYVNVGNVGNVQSVEFWINDSNATDGILELINNATYISIAASAITATGFTSPTIYVNGVATSTLASGWNHVVVTTGTAVAAASFLVGEANTNFTAGLIDEVKVYNRALSATEVRYHYNRGGPVAQWSFNEGSGSVAYDATESNNDGTLILAGSATSSAWVAGKYGGALSFDGVNDYVRVNDSSSFNFSNNVVTLEAWIKTNSAVAADTWILSQCNIDVEAGIELAIPAASGGKLYYYDCDGKEVFSNSDIRDNKWHQVVYVSESLNSHKIYIDGKLDKAATNNVGVLNSTQPLLVGAVLYQSGPIRFFDGLIDEVRVYNYARTAEQIRLDYNAGLSTHFK